MSTVSHYFCVFCDFTCEDYDNAFNHYYSHLFVNGNCEICDYKNSKVYVADQSGLSSKCDKCYLRDNEFKPNELSQNEPIIHYWINMFLSFQKKILDITYEELLMADKVCVECAVCRYLLGNYKKNGGDMSRIQYIRDNKVDHCYQHMRYNPNSERINEYRARTKAAVRVIKILKLEAFIDYCCNKTITGSELINNNNALLVCNKATQFYIENIDTGLVLDIKEWNPEPNAVIQMNAYHGGRNQLWEYRNKMIHSALNNYALDINQSDGRSVITYPANGNPWQKWHFDADNTIRCEFRNLVLDVEHSSRDMCAKVTAYHKHNDLNQLFRIVYV